MLNVTLFMKKDHSPSAEVKAELDRLREKFPHHLIELDVEQDAVLNKKYLEQVPVIETGPYTLKAPITPQSLQKSHHQD